MKFKYKTQCIKTGVVNSHELDIVENGEPNLELVFLRMVDAWNMSSETFKFWRTRG